MRISSPTVKNVRSVAPAGNMFINLICLGQEIQIT